MSTAKGCSRRRWLLLLIVALLASGMTAWAQPEAQGPSRIQLVAVQMTLDLDDYWSYEAFEAKIRRQLRQSLRPEPGLPALVVFLRTWA